MNINILGWISQNRPGHTVGSLEEDMKIVVRTAMRKVAKRVLMPDNGPVSILKEFEDVVATEASEEEAGIHSIAPTAVLY